MTAFREISVLFLEGAVIKCILLLPQASTISQLGHALFSKHFLNQYLTIVLFHGE